MKYSNGKIAIAIFVLAIVVYNVNFRIIDSGDTIPASLVPITLVNDRSIVMDEYDAYFKDIGVTPYFFAKTRHGYLSIYPITASILLTPLYVAPVAALKLVVKDPSMSQWVYAASVFGKLSASLVSSLAVAVFFLVCIRLGCRLGQALLLTGAMALGTEMFSVSSQALWQHGPSVLFMLLSVFFFLSLMEQDRPLYAAMMGLSLGLCLNVRPTNLLFVLALSPVVFTKVKLPGILAALAAFSLPVAGLLVYNYIGFGNIIGGYSIVKFPTEKFPTDLLSGLGGVLFSPGRGLVIYFPLLVFALIGWAGIKSLSDLGVGLQQILIEKPL